MSAKPAKKQPSGYQAKITISGPGVIHVSSSEIIKTDEAKRQIKALGKLQTKGLSGASGMMDTWEYTQKQIDLGIRTIEKGNKIIQEAIDAYEKEENNSQRSRGGSGSITEICQT